ncbi:MAG: hypothetical protein HWE34_01190 [Methylocystaceae bacterium]|nr:hypothetical protein [Methylocystaceae bacterium]
MAQTTRSPHVVGAHYYAKFGYDDALRQVSTHLARDQNTSFWREVIHVLDEMHHHEIKSQHPCAPMPPRMAIRALKENAKAV